MAKHESIRIQQAAEKGVKAIDCIIEAVEAELALERELGIRLVEFDRTLLEPLPKKAENANALVETMRPESVRADGIDKIRNARIIATRNPTPNESRESIAKENAAFSGEVPEFAFLHDRPLVGEALQMIAKIVKGLDKNESTAPLAFAEPIPKAKSYVVLGSKALNKFFPGRLALPGQWIKGEKNEDILVTYSPNFVLRLQKDSPKQLKTKREMWNSLKSISRHLALNVNR